MRFLAIILVLLPFLCRAQQELSFPEGTHYTVGLLKDGNMLMDHQTEAYGIYFGFDKGNWGFVYSGVLGWDMDGNFYAYSGLGQVAAAHIITYPQFISEATVVLSFMVFAIPETVYYKIVKNPRGNFLAIYASPFGYEYKSLDSGRYNKLSAEAGLRGRLVFGRFCAEPFVGNKILYSNGIQGVNFGVAIGYYD